MTARLPRLGTLVVMGALVGACAQIIGLNDYDKTDGGTGGGAGKGGSSGSGGSSAGRGGTGMEAGASGDTSGGTSGRGGSGGTHNTAGTGNEAGAGATAGESSGGSPARGGTGGGGGKGGGGGTGNTSMGGEGGMVTPPDCASTREIETVVVVPTDYANDYAFSIAATDGMAIGSSAIDELWIRFFATPPYTGEETGIFNLAASPDDNYATCVRCVTVESDVSASTGPKTYYFASAGTMTIDPASRQMDGYGVFTIDDLTLIESTIDFDSTYISEPVPNARCLHIAHVEVNNPVPPEPPAEWTCDAAYYGTSDGCDCGCGAVDPDCATSYAGACFACGESGSCADSNCNGIDVTNNAFCTATPGWTCGKYLFGDNYGDGETCDCGCGIVDPDCASPSRNECDTCYYGCSSDGCPGPIDADNNAICTGVPSSWTCLARFFNDGEICNCGCGARDPDCADGKVESCDSCNFKGSCSARDCPGIIDPDNNAFCERPDPPEGWTCSSYQYGNGYSCDCGCGVPDIDCPSDTDPAYCTNCTACGSSSCPGLIDPTDIGKCVPPPPEWECNIFYYGDGFCDCGCGVKDPDCQGSTKDQCYRCDPGQGSCADYTCATIQTNNNALCTNSAPPEWTCPRRFYRDQACDCGCGVRDPDCANGNLSSCKFCNDPGSCSTAAKCSTSNINPTDNSTCVN